MLPPITDLDGGEVQISRSVSTEIRKKILIESWNIQVPRRIFIHRNRWLLLSLQSLSFHSIPFDFKRCYFQPDQIDADDGDDDMNMITRMLMMLMKI